jgi:hypothetical protein
MERETLEPISGKYYKRPESQRCPKQGKKRIGLLPSGPYCPGCELRCKLPGTFWQPGDFIVVSNKEG